MNSPKTLLKKREMGMMKEGDVKQLSSELNILGFYSSLVLRRSCCAGTKDNLHRFSECHTPNLQNRSRNIDNRSYLPGTALGTNKLKVAIKF